MKGRALNLVKAGLSLALLSLVLTRVGLTATVETLREADLGYLLAAMGLYLIGIPLRAYRWQGLLSAHHVFVPLRRLSSLYFVGAFFNNVLPTGIGGDVIRAYELTRDDADAWVTASTVLADRASGMLVLLAMALISAVFAHRLVSLNLILFITAVSLGSFGAVGLLLWDDLWRRVSRRLPRWPARGKIEDFSRLVQIYRGRPVIKALWISLVFNLILIAVNYLIALSLGVRVSLWYFLLFVPLISVSLLLPISISGLGVREGAFVLLFGQAGVGAPSALAMSLAFYVVNVVTGLIGGVIYAFEGVRQWAVEEEAN